MKRKYLLIPIAIFLCIALHSCKSTYMSYKDRPELYAFKIIQDKEVMFAIVDSAYILECLGQYPHLLKEILSNDKAIDSLFNRSVVQRDYELGNRLMEMSEGKDALVIYLVCVKPNGIVALSRMLESNIRVPESRMKRIQHLVFGYRLEEDVYSECLECRKIIITLNKPGYILPTHPRFERN